MKNSLPLAFFLAISLFPSSGWSREASKETVVQVKFKNAQHAEHFMTWMSEQGEQDMYVWMEEAEPELAKMPTYDNEQLVIDYSQPNEP